MKMLIEKVNLSWEIHIVNHKSQAFNNEGRTLGN